MIDAEKLLRKFIDDVKYIAGKYEKVDEAIPMDAYIQYHRLFRGIINQASVTLVELEELLEKEKTNVD